jgi:hypothetical protein
LLALIIQKLIHILNKIQSLEHFQLKLAKEVIFALILKKGEITNTRFKSLIEYLIILVSKALKKLLKSLVCNKRSILLVLSFSQNSMNKINCVLLQS